MGKKRSGKQSGIRVDVKGTSEPSAKTAASNSTNGSGSGAIPKSSLQATTVRTGSTESLTIDADVESSLEKLMNKVHDEVGMWVWLIAECSNRS
jgi:hypothetical protein